MNTRPPPQHEALNQEELELARVVRALPGGGPPAALDALILKAATDAVASSGSQKKSRWGKGFLGTSAMWLGTAAASVLTVGIGWQAFQSMRAPIYELPDSENASSVQETDSSHKDDSLIVEMTPAREPMPTPQPPLEESEQATDAAAPMAAADKPQAMKSEMRERQEMAKVAVEKAKKDETGMQRNQAAEAYRDAPQTAGMAAPTAAPAPPPAPMPAMAAAASAEISEQKELDAVSVSGNRINRTDDVGHAKAVPRLGYTFVTVIEDSKLSPEHWLDAIRMRVERNDIEGAKASLKLFKKKYPKLSIPEVLKPLLK